VFSTRILPARIALMGSKGPAHEAPAGGELRVVVTAQLLKAALPGALVRPIAGAAIEVRPIAGYAAIEQDANGFRSRHIVSGRPFLDSRKHFTRKTNLHGCANRRSSSDSGKTVPPLRSFLSRVLYHSAPADQAGSPGAPSRDKVFTGQNRLYRN
jgi:hypothetical protein